MLYVDVATNWLFCVLVLKLGALHFFARSLGFSGFEQQLAARQFIQIGRIMPVNRLHISAWKRHFSDSIYVVLRYNMCCNLCNRVITVIIGLQLPYDCPIIGIQLPHNFPIIGLQSMIPAHLTMHFTAHFTVPAKIPPQATPCPIELMLFATGVSTYTK